jgi:predicted ribosomally synthesized peptide with SipW-like signal peptide
MSRIDRMSRGRKTLLTLLLVGAIGAVAGLGTYSAFSATTVNPGNSFAAGTVVISDNDANAAMYTITDAKPNDVVTRCIRVTYTGSLPALVRLYTTTPVNAFGQYVTLSIDKGTMPIGTAFPNCTGFTLDAVPNVFSGTLSSFAAAKTNFASGVAANPGAATQWVTNDTLVYRFTLTMQDNQLAVGGSSGIHSFTWEAQNV